MSEAKVQPTYRRIRADILARIRQGEWGPGAVIPGEEALAEAFGCARVTVNRALRELADEGVVERRRKAGTRVVAAPVRQARLEIPLIRQEVEQRGLAYRYQLLERAAGPAPDSVRARLSLPPGAHALHLRCLHLADERPFAYEDRWIDPEAVPGALAEPFEAVGPNEWLVREIPFSEAEHDFSAAAADTTESVALAVAPGSPLFVMERRTWQGGKALTWVRLAFPGPLYRLRAGAPQALGPAPAPRAAPDRSDRPDSR